MPAATVPADLPAVDDLDDAALERELVAWSTRIAAAEARFCSLIAEIDRRDSWADSGLASCAAWVSWRCGLSPGAARERVRVARALEELPDIATAFSAGQLSYSQVRTVTRVATPATDAQWVEWAAAAPASQIERVCSARRKVARLAAADADEIAEGLDVTVDDDGMGVVRLRVRPEELVVVVAALQARMDATRRDDPTADDVPAGQRRAEAILDALRADLVRTEGGRRTPEDGAARPGRTSPELLVHADVAALAGDPHGRSSIDGGPALPPSTVRRLACDTAIRALRVRDGRPLGVGRRRRTVPAWLRAAVRARDHACTFPGCRRMRGLEVHHVVHWADGGSTDLGNLVLVCRRHHRSVHDDGFSVRVSVEQQVTWARPGGAPIPRAAARPQLVEPIRPGDGDRAEGWTFAPDWDGSLLDRRTLDAALAYLDHLGVSAETPTVG